MSRNVVVTGGASGIGAAIVDAFVEEGARIVVLDRAEPQGDREQITYIPCNLADRQAIDAAVDALIGEIDVLCNVAGVSGVAPVPTVMSVNFLAVRYLTARLAPQIVPGGAVVSLASTAGWRWRNAMADLKELLALDDWDDALEWTRAHVTTGYGAYERSKQAVIVWSSVAAQQYLGRFRVNSVSPGPVETPLLADFYESMGHEELDPLTARGGGRNGTPTEIAQAVHFMAGPASSWINGTDVVIDAGAEMAEMLAAEGLIPPMG